MDEIHVVWSQLQILLSSQWCEVLHKEETAGLGVREHGDMAMSQAKLIFMIVLRTVCILIK
jgi:hypothetical protein